VNFHLVTKSLGERGNIAVISLLKTTSYGTQIEESSKNNSKYGWSGI